MALHQTLGAAGEQYVYEYLIKQGFIVRETNWRMGHLEVDIIAERNGTFHFVEVKTRATRGAFDPRRSVNRKKQENLINASRSYCRMCGRMDVDVQYDVALIFGTADSDNQLIRKKKRAGSRISLALYLYFTSWKGLFVQFFHQLLHIVGKGFLHANTLLHLLASMQHGGVVSV